jgi:transcriptional regulator with XRE-family HTH domain
MQAELKKLRKMAGISLDRLGREVNLGRYKLGLLEQGLWQPAPEEMEIIRNTLKRLIRKDQAYVSKLLG